MLNPTAYSEHGVNLSAFVPTASSHLCYVDQIAIATYTFSIYNTVSWRRFKTDWLK